MAEKKELEYEIVEHLGTLGEAKKGFIKEVNMIKWGSAKEPKFDMRTWKIDEDGSRKPAKGMTLSDDEAGSLLEILQNKY